MQEKKIGIFPLPSVYKLLNTRKQISLQIDKVAKCTYFTYFWLWTILTQLTKIPANDIMWSSYDFMQCKRNSDTISVSIHNIHFNFTLKHDSKIVAKKIIIICKLKMFLKFLN